MTAENITKKSTKLKTAYLWITNFITDEIVCVEMQFVIFGFVLLILNRCFGSEENVYTTHVAYGKNLK